MSYYYKSEHLRLIMKKVSKSDYVQSLKCLNYVWHKFNDKEKLPSLDGVFIVQRGVEFGKLAQELYPDGISIKFNYTQASKDTADALDLGKPIFEATFETDKLYCMVDVLVPAEDGWDIVEVKSGSSVKKEHYDDVAFQKYVLEKSGIKVNKCYLMHANKKYIREGEIDINELFMKTDITEKVEEVINTVPGNVERLLSYVSKDMPENKHKFCTSPKKCDLREICWAHLPEHNILELHGLWFKHSVPLMDEGYLSILDLPDSFFEKHKHTIQKNAISSGEAQIDHGKIREFKETLKYPLSYFDFETLGTPVPLHDGLNPWGKFAFQYSIHVDDGKKLDHFEFLADSNKDPQEDLVKKLVKDMPSTGSIVTFNMRFEKGILSDLAKRFPKYEKELKSMIDRVVDLQVVFKGFHYYHPSQKGSNSLKAVLPVFSDKKHSDLEISDGTESFTAFYDKYYLGKDVSRKDLLDYCALDTLAMVEILEGI